MANGGGPEILFHESFHPDALVLTRRGEWSYHDGPFENEKLAALFHRSIVWDDREKRYLLSIGRSRSPFKVEDTAYFVTDLSVEGSIITVDLNDGSREELDRSGLFFGDGDECYCRVKGGHRARFLRGAHRDLLEDPVDEETIRLGGHLIQIRRES